MPRERRKVEKLGLIRAARARWGMPRHALWFRAYPSGQILAKSNTTAVFGGSAPGLAIEFASLVIL